MSRRNKNNQIQTADAFSNPIFRLGFGSQSPLEATEYPLTRLTQDYAKLNSMYRSGSILQSVVDIVPADMLREWFTISGSIDPDKQDDLTRLMRRTKLRDRLDEGLRWGRLYGGAVGLILIKGQENRLDKPLNLKSILPDSFAGLLILDRWSGVSPELGLVEDMADPDFGLPEYYTINSGESGKIVARVHHSRIVRFTGRDLPYYEKMAEVYWGESEIEPIYNDIVLYDNVMANMGGLTFRANTDTLFIKNLEQLFSTSSTEQQKRFWNMMQAQSVAQSNFGYRLMDQENTTQNTQYTFTGWNYVIEAIQTNLAAASHIPITKLFGRSPAGMNATGESDLQNYYDYIDGLRESKLRPVLEKLMPVICMSALGEVPEDAEIVFPPLWTPTAQEVAGIAAQKSQAIIGAFQAALLDQGQAMKELKKLADDTGMFDSIEDEDIEAAKGKTYQDVTAMQDPMAGLFASGGMPEEQGAEAEGAEEDNPFKETADYDPMQPRDQRGRWSNVSGLTPEDAVFYHTPELDRALEIAENKIKTAKTEHGVLLDANGEELFHVISEKDDEIDLSDSQLEMLEHNIFTHNHPSGSPFSPDDIGTAFEYKCLELRATGPRGTFVLVRRFNEGDHIPAKYANFADEYSKAVVKAYIAAEKSRKSGALTRQESRELWYNRCAEWLSSNAKSYGWEYKKL